MLYKLAFSGSSLSSDSKSSISPRCPFELVIVVVVVHFIPPVDVVASFVVHSSVIALYSWLSPFTPLFVVLLLVLVLVFGPRSSFRSLRYCCDVKLSPLSLICFNTFNKARSDRMLITIEIVVGLLRRAHNLVIIAIIGH